MNEKRNIINLTDVERTLRRYYDQLYADKFDN